MMQASSAVANGGRALSSTSTNGTKLNQGAAAVAAIDSGDIALRSGDSARALRGTSARAGVSAAAMGGGRMGEDEERREAWLRKQTEIERVGGI